MYRTRTESSSGFRIHNTETKNRYRYGGYIRQFRRNRDCDQLANYLVDCACAAAIFLTVIFLGASKKSSGASLCRCSACWAASISWRRFSRSWGCKLLRKGEKQWWCGSVWLLVRLRCGSGSSGFSQCGSGFNCFLNADPDPADFLNANPDSAAF